MKSDPKDMQRITQFLSGEIKLLLCKTAQHESGVKHHIWAMLEKGDREQQDLLGLPSLNTHLDRKTTGDPNFITVILYPVIKY